ncbi:MAG: radical SAM protein [Endomicrobiales bacterium]|nr:radical SAM protein [Endomicrobiales bacterium]
MTKNAGEKFYLQGTDLSKECFNGSPLVNFEWNIVYSCNFRCPYCFFKDKWEEYGKRNRFPGVAWWKEFWKGISERYGRCTMVITGGEPFLYPDFIELIKEITKYHHPINISTNGTFDADRVAALLDPAKISMSLSFHPGFNGLKDILAKQRGLKEKGFQMGDINLCCYPPFFERLDEWVSEVRLAGEFLRVIPFVGTYNGKDYPFSYSKEERKVLGMGEVWENNVKRKGKLCKAGMKGALIYPDGKVGRCGQIGERRVLGNIFEKELVLLKEPEVCDAEICPCLESEVVD